MNKSFLKKYSPKNLENFLLDNDIINFIKNLIQTNNINIIINGECGSGKTTFLNVL